MRYEIFILSHSLHKKKSGIRMKDKYSAIATLKNVFVDLLNYSIGTT